MLGLEFIAGGGDLRHQPDLGERKATKAAARQQHDKYGGKLSTGPWGGAGGVDGAEHHTRTTRWDFC